MSKTQDRKGDCGRQLRLPKALKYAAYEPGRRAGAGETVAAASSFVFSGFFSEETAALDARALARTPLLFGRRAPRAECKL